MSNNATKIDIVYLGREPCPECKADAVKWTFELTPNYHFVSCVECDRIHAGLKGHATEEWDISSASAIEDVSSLAALNLATDPNAG